MAKLSESENTVPYHISGEFIEALLYKELVEDYLLKTGKRIEICTTTINKNNQIDLSPFLSKIDLTLGDQAEITYNEVNRSIIVSKLQPECDFCCKHAHLLHIEDINLDICNECVDYILGSLESPDIGINYTFKSEIAQNGFIQLPDILIEWCFSHEKDEFLKTRKVRTIVDLDNKHLEISMGKHCSACGENPVFDLRTGTCRSCFKALYTGVKKHSMKNRR